MTVNSIAQALSLLTLTQAADNNIFRAAILTNLQSLANTNKILLSKTITAHAARTAAASQCSEYFASPLTIISPTIWTQQGTVI